MKTVKCNGKFNDKDTCIRFGSFLKSFST